MARRKVVVTPTMMVKRSAPKGPFLGWGYYQVRRMYNIVKSPRLRKFHACIAGKLAGKTFDSLEAVQKAFAEAAKACSAEIGK